jgi:hypothetical protein
MATTVRYYVNSNAQDDGNHEVHQVTVCPTPAEPKNRVYLGYFSSCKGAVHEAKKYYTNVDGCRNCSEDCHNG